MCGELYTESIHAADEFRIPKLLLENRRHCCDIAANWEWRSNSTHCGQNDGQAQGAWASKLCFLLFYFRHYFADIHGEIYQLNINLMCQCVNLQVPLTISLAASFVWSLRKKQTMAIRSSGHQACTRSKLVSRATWGRSCPGTRSSTCRCWSPLHLGAAHLWNRAAASCFPVFAEDVRDGHDHQAPEQLWSTNALHLTRWCLNKHDILQFFTKIPTKSEKISRFASWVK